MIFVTVGTNETPFDRLVAAAGALVEVDPEIVVQAGPSTVTLPDGCRRIGLIDHADFLALLRNAASVVSHAGVGSILTCLGQGKRPIVVPRRAGLGEAVDDHQIQIARRFAAKDLVSLVENDGDLVRAVREAAPILPAVHAEASGLALDLRDYLDRVCDAQARRA